MQATLPALFCLLFLIAGIRGLNVSSEDVQNYTVAATPKNDLHTTKAGAKSATSAPTLDHGGLGDFDLSDAMDDTAVTPTKKSHPGHGGGGGSNTFGDDDLFDGDLPPNDPSGTDGRPGGGEEEVQGPEKQGVVAGILSALGVAAVGAISSFIAYQKKKLCFKGQGEDPENVNMDNQKGDQNDPQVQTNLLSK